MPARTFADLVSGFYYSAQMILGSATNNRRVLGLLALTLASPLGLLSLPPIVQNQNYHHFADQRTFFGIPHFWNVVSNIPFIGIGAVGLWQFGRSPATMLLFLGIFLTGFGSAYYHLGLCSGTGCRWRLALWRSLPLRSRSVWSEHTMNIFYIIGVVVVIVVVAGFLGVHL